MDEPGLNFPISLNSNFLEEQPEKPRGRWTPEEDDCLKALVQRLGSSNWDLIASFLPGRSEPDCKYRYNRVLDPDLVKGFWTKEEDAMLIGLVSKFGNQKWARIAKYLKGRRGKQCRERWHNHLDPSVNKNAWTTEEDLVICKAHSVIGTSWSKIARLLPGRTDNSIKNRWYSSLRHKIATGALVVDDDPLLPIKAEAGEEDRAPSPVEESKDDSCNTSLTSESLTDTPEDMRPTPEPLSNYDQDFCCDVVLDSDPVPDVPDQGTSDLRVSRRKRKLGTNRTCYNTDTSSSRSRSSADGVLQMIAEDMLPLSLVEGSGFRSFVAAVCPRHPRLSQRTLGLRLYDAVEKTAKPRLIGQLRDCRAVSGESADIHVTADVWAGDDADPVLAVRLHFLDEAWNVRRPTVAFRHLRGKNLNSLVTRELEAVLLSYGLFPENIGYIIAHEAKSTISAHDFFCDYKIMHSAQKNDPEEDELVDFLDDQVYVDGFSEILLGTHTDCTGGLLHSAIREALKSCKSVDHALSQLRDVVLFFRRNVYWDELLLREFKFSLAGPYSYGAYAWNSTFASVRRLTSEFAWDAARALLAQAHKDGADDPPPALRVDRERAADAVGLLEPFEEAVQVLQGDGVTFSLVIPSIIGIDRTLAAKATGHPPFCRALRASLRDHFQPLIMKRDLILATILDPRIKLQPFEDDRQDDSASAATLNPPTKVLACSVLESAVSEMDTWIPVEEGTAALDREDELAARAASLGNIKSKKVFRLERPRAAMTPGSELDLYLSEPLLDGDSSVEAFWKEATRFPQLRSLCHRLLAVPASSGGFRRLFPLAASIVRARRNRLPQHTTERLLLYRECVKARGGKQSSELS
ncbi:v-myb avian myeloblastosis viral oncogene homolog-like 2a isoform X2 [Trichomycterus rosablanca]|uniref:v-myb avian myeloblastosis viral oncogene homolog-like 2a isoform X2 n=1 Tax=Trichomycterus rosablanca TaxID=2290929 RepID=UPI002F3547C2